MFQLLFNVIVAAPEIITSSCYSYSVVSADLTYSDMQHQAQSLK